MAPPQGGQGGEGGTGSDFLWAIVGILAVVLVIWFVGKEHILRALFTVKLFELDLIHFYTNNYDKIGRIFDAYYSNPTELDPGLMYQMLVAIGKVISIPIGIFLVMLGVYLYFLHPSLSFNRRFDMLSLRKSEVALWPQIAPTVNLNLVTTPIDEGPWAMALTPMEFAKANKILQEEHGQVTRAHARLYGDVTVTLIRDKAETLLKKQIGPRWEGIERLPIYAQALFAIFAARSHQDRKGAMELTKRIAASSSSGKLDFTGAAELLAKHKDKRDVQQIVGRHAYVLTVLASMLELGRLDGVLASADFLWLKPVDRRMWYMLNSVGRQTPFVEVGGPFAHWLVEKSLNRRLSRPTVDEAVKALDIALKDTIYVPDEFQPEKQKT